MNPDELTLRKRLFEKLHAVMSDVQYIQKDAKNTEQKYTYASEAAIKAALHKAFVEYKVGFLPSVTDLAVSEAGETQRGGKRWFCSVDLDCEFYDVETGYGITKQFRGLGIDSQDKGIWKAITGAVKYFLANSFLIETGDDPEAEGVEGQRIKARAKAIEKAAQSVGKSAKGYDKKKAEASIKERCSRLEAIAGKEPAEKIVAEIFAKYGWESRTDPIKLSDAGAAREMYGVLSEACLIAADESEYQDLIDKAGGKKRFLQILGALGYESVSDIPEKEKADVLKKVKDEIELGV